MTKDVFGYNIDRKLASVPLHVYTDAYKARLNLAILRVVVVAAVPDSILSRNHVRSWKRQWNQQARCATKADLIKTSIVIACVQNSSFGSHPTSSKLYLLCLFFFCLHSYRLLSAPEG